MIWTSCSDTEFRPEQARQGPITKTHYEPAPARRPKMNSNRDSISILLHKTLQTLYILMTNMNPSRLNILSTLLPIVSWRLGGGSGNRFSITARERNPDFSPSRQVSWRCAWAYREHHGSELGVVIVRLLRLRRSS